MFGIAVARLDQVNQQEKDRYQAFYCGLCRAIKRRYGQLSRAVLSYDLAFLAIFLSSLHEPEEQAGQAHCVAHPRKQMPFCETEFSDYAADLSVAFAYHKVLDDVADEGGLKAKASEAALRRAYARACGRIPNACAAISACMENIRALEEAPDTPPDACANEFGRLMACVFAAAGAPWQDGCARFGYALGKLVYTMDAAVDLREDEASHNYNPFAGTDIDFAEMREILVVMAGDAADAFERLPLVQDAHLMQSVLYAGIWQKFNHTYKDELAEALTEDFGKSV